MRTWLASFCLLIGVGIASAADECDKSIVLQKTIENVRLSNDWRLAILVDETTWNEASKDARFKGRINGLPIGASYREFQENYRRLVNKYGESLSIQQARDIVTISLDPDSKRIYRDCQAARIFTSFGFWAIPLGADDADHVLIRLRWPVAVPPATSIQWVGLPPGVIPSPNPSTLVAGDYTVSLPRRDTVYSISVNASGTGLSTNSVDITPPAPKLKRTYRSAYFIVCLATSGETPPRSGCDKPDLLNAYKDASPEIFEAVNQPNNIVSVAGDRYVSYPFPAITEGPVDRVTNKQCSPVGGNLALSGLMALVMLDVDANGRLSAKINANYIGTINDNFRDDVRKWSLVWMCEADFELRN